MCSNRHPAPSIAINRQIPKKVTAEHFTSAPPSKLSLSKRKEKILCCLMNMNLSIPIYDAHIEVSTLKDCVPWEKERKQSLRKH